MIRKIIDFLQSQLNALQPPKRSAAAVAKERLQIIVSHESNRKSGSEIIKQLQKELIEVISKYVKVDQEMIKVQLERNGDHSVLELNVTMPDVAGLVTAAESAR